MLRIEFPKLHYRLLSAFNLNANSYNSNFDLKCKVVTQKKYRNEEITVI
jgi:hypothetical protein